jgi:hypothetical protein
MHSLYLTASGSVVAAVVLWFAIAALRRRGGLNTVATLPVAPENSLQLPAGQLVLHLAGPLGKTGLGQLSFELLDRAGTRVPGRAILTRTLRSSPAGSALLAVRRFAISATGDHRLLAIGISQDRDYSDCAFVLARPGGAGLVLAIVGVVLSAIALLVCTVFSLILWLSPEAFGAVSNG